MLIGYARWRVEREVIKWLRADVNTHQAALRCEVRRK